MWSKGKACRKALLHRLQTQPLTPAWQRVWTSLYQFTFYHPMCVISMSNLKRPHFYIACVITSSTELFDTFQRLRVCFYSILSVAPVIKRNASETERTWTELVHVCVQYVDMGGLLVCWHRKTRLLPHMQHALTPIKLRKQQQVALECFI